MSASPARLVLLGVAAAYAIGLALLGLYLVREILALMFIAWIVAAALRPPVESLGRYVHPGLAIAAVYLMLVLGATALMLLIVPPLVLEMIHLAEQLPLYISHLQEGMGLLESWLTQLGLDELQADPLSEAVRLISQQLRSLVAVPLAALRLTVSFLAVVVLSIYWLLFRERAVDWLVGFLPQGTEARVRSLFDRAEAQMGAYVRGLVLLCLTVGGLTLVGLLALGVPFALALAVIAAMLELLPNIGPVLAAVPAIIVAATRSPFLALAVALLYLIVQQIENYVLVPKVQERAVGLNPLATLLAVLLGATLGGVVGALLAVPIAALLALLLDEWRKSRERGQPSAVAVGPVQPEE